MYIGEEENKHVVVVIGQHNALEFFAAKRNVFSGMSKVLLNDIFAECIGSRRIKNIVILTD